MCDDNRCVSNAWCGTIYLSLHKTRRNICAQSDCVSDEVINPHPRFWTLTGNIRERRGSKVDIRVPIYSGGSLKRRELEKSKQRMMTPSCSNLMMWLTRSRNKLWIANTLLKQVTLRLIVQLAQARIVSKNPPRLRNVNTLRWTAWLLVWVAAAYK